MTKKIVWKALDNLSPSDVKLTQLPRKPDGLYNMHFNEYGQIVKRAGYTEYNATSIGASHPIRGMHRFYKQDTYDKTFLVAWNTNVYKFGNTPTATSWDLQYVCTVEPDADTPVWTLGGTDYASCTDGILTIDTSASVARTCYYYRTPDVDFSSGFLVQFKAQMISDEGTYPFGIWIRDGSQNLASYLYFLTDSIYQLNPATSTLTKICDFDSTDDYHVYKIVIVGTTGTLYIDDTYKGEWAVTPLGYCTDLIQFGNENNASSIKIYLDYLYYTSDFTSVMSSISIKSGLTADSDTYFCDFLNHCYFVNGVDGVFKYDLANVRTVCPAPPAAKPTGVGGSTGGSLGVGNYYFCYTYVDEDGYEGNPSPVSDAIDVASGEKVTLTIVNSDDTKIASRNIYRTSLAGAIYYYDGEVADNTTETYTSSQADSTLGDAVIETHTVPPTTSHLIAKRRERLYLAYNQYVYPSHISDVEYFPATWRQRVGNSQKIMGLIELLTELPVLTEDSVERLTGTDEDNFEFKNAYSTEGCIAMRSLVNCDNLAVYLGYNGINWHNGTASGIFSKALNKYIKDNIVDGSAYLSCAVYWEDKYILCYPKTGGTYPTETIWIDLKNQTYGVYSFAFSCFSKWDRGTDGLQLKGGSNTEGQIYSVFSGLDDDGSAITAYDDIEPLDMGKPEVYKQWYSVSVKIKSTTGTAFRLYYTLDNGDETYASKTLTADTTKWYRIGLGSGGKRARAFKPRPYMSDKYAFEIHGIAICYEEEPFAEENE